MSTEVVDLERQDSFVSGSSAAYQSDSHFSSPLTEPVKKTSSDKLAINQTKKKSKSKSFVNFFHKKKSQGKKNKKTKESGDGAFQSMGENNELCQGNDIGVINIPTSRETNILLQNKIEELEIQLEESRLNSAVLRTDFHESQLLKNKVENLTDETERFQLQLSFLEEEKVEYEKKIANSQEDQNILFLRFSQAAKKRDFYKKSFQEAQKRGYIMSNDLTEKVNALILENRNLTRQHLKGKPAEIILLLNTTDRLIKLEADNNQLRHKYEKELAKSTKRAVFVDNLRQDLIEAMAVLEMEGINWSPSSINSLSSFDINVSGTSLIADLGISDDEMVNQKQAKAVKKKVSDKTLSLTE